MNTGWVTSVGAAIPPLAALGARVWMGSSDTRLVRKIEKDIALLEIAPERSKEVLEQLILVETKAHAKRRLSTATRKINWGVAFWVVVGVVLVGLALWGIANYALDHPDWWPLWILFAVVALIGVLWIGAGGGTIFKYPDEDDAENEPEEGEA